MSDSDARLVLNPMLSEMATLLRDRIKDKTATAADLSVARQLLRDNGVTAIPVKTSPLGRLVDEMPTFDGDGLPTH
jgi:hypothetical protein